MKDVKKIGDHPDERTIELFVLKSDLLKDQRAVIARHLKECAGCAELLREIEEYYAEAGRLQSAQEEKTAHALYAPDRAIKPRDFPQAGVVAKPISVPQKFVQSIRHHPLRWSAGSLAVVAVALFLLPQVFTLDRNPAYARGKDEFIIAYNAAGNELWRKYIGEGYDLKMAPSWITRHTDRALATYDVDGDHQNEILAIFGWTSIQNPKVVWDNTIICLNGDGSERWSYSVHRKVVIGGVEFADNYRIHVMLTGDFDRDGKGDILLGASQIPWYPNVLVRLNADDGSFVSEYWHNGTTPYIDQKDLDGDGIEELLLVGQNNRFRMACLLVLDPRKIEGYGPAPREFKPANAPPGSEKFYLAFPPTDLKDKSVDITNMAFNIEVRANGLIEAIVSEPLDKYWAEVYYYLDSTLTCVRVSVSDHFVAAHRLMEQEGRSNRHVDASYLEGLRTAVQYWDGERFVGHVTPVRKPVLATAK